MAFRWPWAQRAHRARDGGGAERVAIASTPGHLVWLHSDAEGRPLRAGIELLAGADAAECQRRVRALGLPAARVTALLALGEAQLLQIETPAVKPEELKSAARWRIKDLVETRLDELTIDVMHVGPARERAAALQPHLFVVAARNALIQDLSRRCQAQGLALGAIDITETAQRNLQSAAAAAAGLAGRASAALMRHGDKALLTLCAGGELYYARQLDWDEGGLAPQSAAAPLQAHFGDIDFVDYGAADASPEAGAPRLVVEVQRSLDVWERTWPDLPVAALWVHAGDASARLAQWLEPALGCAVKILEPRELFPAYARAAPTAEIEAATWPLLGALLRDA